MTKNLQRRVEALERRRDDAILAIIRPRDDGRATVNGCETSKSEVARLLASGRVVAITRSYGATTW